MVNLCIPVPLWSRDMQSGVKGGGWGYITLYSMKLMVQAILRDVYHLCQQKPVLGIKVALCCQGKPFSLML